MVRVSVFEIFGTDEPNSQQLELKISPRNTGKPCSETKQAFTHSNKGIGYSIIDLEPLKEKHSHLYPLPDNKIKFADVKMIVKRTGCFFTI